MALNFTTTINVGQWFYNLTLIYMVWLVGGWELIMNDGRTKKEDV